MENPGRAAYVRVTGIIRGLLEELQRHVRAGMGTVRRPQGQSTTLNSFGFIPVALPAGQ
jgi:hypothetical protein